MITYITVDIGRAQFSHPQLGAKVLLNLKQIYF